MPVWLQVVFGVVGLVAYIIILIDAFRDAIWKGIVGILCGLYLLYYAIFEFEHEYKWPLVLLWILGWGAGGLG